MENETRPQLFIMDEWLGDPIPLAEIKEISELHWMKSMICRILLV